MRPFKTPILKIFKKKTMEGPAKRFWTHNVDSFPKQANEHNPLDTCAICRGSLSSRCVECEAKELEDIDLHLKTESKKLWDALLLVARRSPFSTLPLSIVWQIYQFAQPHVERSSCPECILYCNHSYHLHCFRRWLARRESCPLCNSFQPRDGGDGDLFVTRMRHAHMIAENCYTSSEEFVTKKDNYERASAASAFVVSFLKRFATCSTEPTWISQDVLFGFYVC